VTHLELPDFVLGGFLDGRRRSGTLLWEIRLARWEQGGNHRRCPPFLLKTWDNPGRRGWQRFCRNSESDRCGPPRPLSSVCKLGIRIFVRISSASTCPPWSFTRMRTAFSQNCDFKTSLLHRRRFHREALRAQCSLERLVPPISGRVPLVCNSWERFRDPATESWSC
jgi:hypothetical protein